MGDDDWENGRLKAEDQLRKPAAPERLLLLAIINRAAQDLFSQDNYVRRQAEIWLAQEIEEGPPEPFSFLWIMEELGIDPEACPIQPVQDVRGRPARNPELRQQQESMRPCVRRRVRLGCH